MMKLCFSTIGCPDWRFADIVSAATDLGYSAIEIRGVEGEIYAPAIKELTDDFPRTKELLDRTGIKIATLPIIPSKERAWTRRKPTSTWRQKWARSL